MLDPKNHATLISNNGLRPQMSLSFVQMGPAAAFAIKYAPPILWGVILAAVLFSKRDDLYHPPYTTQTDI
jgi:hypothetical protein